MASNRFSSWGGVGGYDRLDILSKTVENQSLSSAASGKSSHPSGPLRNAFVVGSALAYALSPTISWLFTGLALAWQGRRNLTLAWNFVAFLPIALLVNSSKEISGDWGWYSRQFMSDYPHLALSQVFSQLSPANQIEEPLYYVEAWVLAQLFPGHISLLVLLILVTTYGSATLGAGLIARELELNALEAAALQYMLFGYGITFTLVTHLVRQSMAGAILTVVLGLVMQKKMGQAIVVTLIAVLTHTPSAVLGTFILLVGLLSVRKSGWKVLALAPIGFAMGVGYWFFSGRSYGGVDNGGVSPFLILLEVSILAGLLLFIQQSEPGRLRVFLVVASVELLYMAFLLGTSAEPLPLLRFFLYLTPISSIGAFLLYRAFLGKFLGPNLRVVALSVLGLGAVLAITLRIAVSPFSFGYDFLSLSLL